MRFQYIQVHSGPLPQYTVDFNYFFSKILCFMNGALAQLGERFAGSEEVSGSIPLCSTITHFNQSYRFIPLHLNPPIQIISTISPIKFQLLLCFTATL